MEEINEELKAFSDKTSSFYLSLKSFLEKIGDINTRMTSCLIELVTADAETEKVERDFLEKIVEICQDTQYEKHTASRISKEMADFSNLANEVLIAVQKMYLK